MTPFLFILCSVRLLMKTSGTVGWKKEIILKSPKQRALNLIGIDIKVEWHRSASQGHFVCIVYTVNINWLWVRGIKWQHWRRIPTLGENHMLGKTYHAALQT